MHNDNCVCCKKPVPALRAWNCKMGHNPVTCNSECDTQMKRARAEKRKGERTAA